MTSRIRNIILAAALVAPIGLGVAACGGSGSSSPQSLAVAEQAINATPLVREDLVFDYAFGERAVLLRVSGSGYEKAWPGSTTVHPFTVSNGRVAVHGSLVLDSPPSAGWTVYTLSSDGSLSTP